MDLLSSGDETVFCHQISCLMLIFHTCKDDPENTYTAFGGPGYERITVMFKKFRRKMIFLLIDLIQAAHVEYTVLLQHIVDNAGQPAAELFDHRMHGLVKNKNVFLYDFLEVMDPLTLSGNEFIERNSMFGIFLRRTLLILTKMSFNQMSELGKALESYLSVKKPWEGLDESTSDASMDLETEVREQPKEKMNTLSQAGRFITQQAWLLESQSPNSLPPKKLQEKIDEIFEKFPNAVDAYYLSYLNYLRLGEVRNALLSLHKYFDYQKWDAETTSNNNNTDADKNSVDKYQMKFKRFRYCALNLGILHCTLGHDDLALSAMEEAVKMAQITNDNDCLLHTLFWLHRLKSKSDPLHSRSLLEQFTSKAEEFGYSQLQSLGILTQCRSDAFNGSSDFQNIQLRLNKIDSMIATKSDIPSRQIQIGRSALLDFFGFRSVACHASQIALYETENINLSTLNGLPTSAFQDPKSTVLALCQTARYLADEGLVHEAQDILQFGTSLIPEHSSDQKWLMLCKWQLIFDRCVFLQDIKGAKQAVTEIRPIDEQDADLKDCNILFLSGNTLESASKIEEVLKKFLKNTEATFGNTPSAIYHVRLLQLKAELFASSQELPKAIDCLLECVDICRKYKMRSIEAEISLLLAQYKVRLGLLKQSKSILEKKMIHILSHGTLYVRSLAFLVLAKTTLFCITKEMATAKSEMLALLPTLEKALGGFRTLNAETLHCETLYIMAQVYNCLEYTAERNKCAKELKQKLELRASRS